MSLITNLLESFKANKEGFAARKLSAFAAVAISVFTSLEYTDKDNLIYVIGIWLVFALLLLGIVTADQLIRLKGELPANDKKPTEL